MDVFSGAKVNLGGVIGYLHEGTINEALQAIGSQETSLCLGEGIWHIQADLDIPENVALHITRGAVLNIYDGVTLRIFGQIEAGVYKIFDYIGTGKVIWAYRLNLQDTSPQEWSKQVLYPEWWGAVGDDVAIDTVPLQRMFAVPSTTNKALECHFTSGKTYRCTAALRLGKVGSPYNSYIVRGHGARLFFVGEALKANPAVQIGSWVDSPLDHSQVY